jgi:hypothetical protein
MEVHDAPVVTVFSKVPFSPTANPVFKFTKQTELRVFVVPEFTDTSPFVNRINS